MKRVLVLCVLLAGCSTAPIADFMDHFFPAKIDPNATPGARTRGGVCDPPPTVMPTPTTPPGGLPPAVPAGPASGPAPLMAPPNPGSALPSPDPPQPLIRF